METILVGLGNPGSEFARTRHNVGAEAVELLAERLGGRLGVDRRVRARLARVRLGERAVILAVPTTYMNDSGQAVSALVRRYALEDLEHLVVVHDELDLPVGVVKVKSGGGSAGHNGLRSIQAHLHDSGYTRVRIGIGRPPSRDAGADYVLSRPKRLEREQLDLATETAADALEEVATSGVTSAMNRFNT